MLERRAVKSRFNGFELLQETVETVSGHIVVLITPLKRGVNDTTVSGSDLVARPRAGAAGR